MMDEADIIRDASAKLEAAGIPFMLTGSLAMSYYAQPRMTRDIEIVIALKPAGIQKIVQSFDSDYYVSSDAVASAVSHASMFNVIHNETVIKIDFIIRKSADYRINEFNRRQKVTIRDFDVWITSKEDLIISKLFWAKDSRSEIQFNDIKNLIATGYDKAYIEHWTKKLNLFNLWEECLNE